MLDDRSTLPYSATVEEACRLFGIGRTELYSLLAAGAVQAKRHGKRTLVLTDSLRRYVEGLPDATFGSPPKPLQNRPQPSMSDRRRSSRSVRA